MFIAIRLLTTQPEVAVYCFHRISFRMEQVEQHHTVCPAAYGNQQFIG
jgi:hypothetical protein